MSKSIDFQCCPSCVALARSLSSKGQALFVKNLAPRRPGLCRHCGRRFEKPWVVDYGASAIRGYREGEWHSGASNPSGSAGAGWGHHW